MSAALKLVKPCPGCAKARQECWKAPCIHLQILLRGSLIRLQRWANEGGGRIIFDESPKARNAKTTKFWMAAGLL